MCEILFKIIGFYSFAHYLGQEYVIDLIEELLLSQ